MRINAKFTLKVIVLITISMVLIVSVFYADGDKRKLHIHINNISYVYDIQRWDQIKINYIHSIHLTSVEETFIINNDFTFQLASYKYQDIGWGSPYFFQQYESNEQHFKLKGEQKKHLMLNQLDYGFISLNEPRIFIKNKLIPIHFNEKNRLKIYITK